VQTVPQTILNNIILLKLWGRFKYFDINKFQQFFIEVTAKTNIPHPLDTKIGHCGQVLPSQSLSMVQKKLNLT